MKLSAHRLFWPAVIFAAALLVRGILWFSAASDPERLCRPDSTKYLISARSLAHGAGYEGTRRPPGFPVIAAAVYRCGGGAKTIALLLTLLGAATAVVIYRCGELCTSRAGGVISGGLYALNLTAAGNAPLLLADTLFGLLTAVEFLIFLRCWKEKKPGYYLLCCAVAGLAVLVKPINLLFILPLTVLFCLLPRPENFSRRRKLLYCGAGAAIFLAVLVPWMIRNARCGAGMCIDTNTGAMLHQNGAMLLGEVNGTGYEAEKQRILREQEEIFADIERFPDEKSREEWRMNEYKKLIIKHFPLWLRQQIDWRILLPDAPAFLECLGITQSDRGTMAVLKNHGFFAAVRHYFGKNFLLLLLLLSPLLAVTMLTFAAFFAAVATAVWHWRKHYFEVLVLLAFVEYYLLLPGSIVAPRYQLPALPCICVAASWFILMVWQKWSRRREQMGVAECAEKNQTS